MTGGGTFSLSACVYICTFCHRYDAPVKHWPGKELHVLCCVYSRCPIKTHWQRMELLCFISFTSLCHFDTLHCKYLYSLCFNKFPFLKFLHLGVRDFWQLMIPYLRQCNLHIILYILSLTKTKSLFNTCNGTEKS